MLQLRNGIISLLCCLGILSAAAQKHPTRISRESLLVLPPDYDVKRSYPVLVLMPYTNGSAHDFWNKYLSEAKIQREGLGYREQLGQFLEVFNAQFQSEESFALIIPDGTGSRNDHSWEGFSACIERYENRVLRDLRRFAELHSLDTTRVYLAGVSLGGDLSWALSVRQPQSFAGAVVVGSRCSFPPPAPTLPLLADKGFRFFMVMGMNEGNDRLVGMRYARRLLDSSLVHYTYREMPFLEHDRAPLWLFLQALRWTMFERSPLLRPAPQAVLELYQGSYLCELETKQYALAEGDDLSARGNALLLPQSIERQGGVLAELYPDTACSHCIRLHLPGLPALRLRLLRDPERPFDPIAVELPEQEAGSYKYQGLAQDWTQPRRHGTLDLGARLLLLDFEGFPLRDHNRRTGYSLLLPLD